MVGEGGIRRVLRLNPQTGGTESVPLASLTDDELRAMLPVGESEWRACAVCGAEHSGDGPSPCDYPLPGEEP